MNDLTERQREFLERFVLKRRLDALGLDPAEQAPAPDLEHDAETARRLLMQLGPPPGATSAEAGELTGLQREGLSLLTPPLSAAELREAGRIAERMRDPHDRCTRRIERDRILAACDAQEARGGNKLLEDDLKELGQRLEITRGRLTEPAPRDVDLSTGADEVAALKVYIDDALVKAQKDRAEREERAAALREAVKAVKVEHLLETETVELAAATAAVTAVWGKPPSWDQISAAETALDDAQRLADKLADAVEFRAAEARSLRTDLQAVLVDGADEDESASLDDEREKHLSNLSDHPAPEQVSATREGLETLRGLADEIAQAVAERKQRRDVLLSRMGACRVEGLTRSETADLAAVEAAFPGLSGVPDAATLAVAGEALTALQALAETLRQVVAARRDIAARFDAALKTLVWGQGDFAPPEAIPDGLIAPVRVQVEALAQSHAVLADPAKADAWPETATSGLERRLADLGTERDKARATLMAVTEAWARVSKALQEAGERIESAGLHKLSAGQKSALHDRADTAAALLASEATEADAAVAALKQVGEDTVALQRGLRALAQRIAAVDLTPAHASKKEIAALAALHKAAIAELDAAMP